jgi:hypothetical protein
MVILRPIGILYHLRHPRAPHPLEVCTAQMRCVGRRGEARHLLPDVIDRRPTFVIARKTHAGARLLELVIAQSSRQGSMIG